VPFFYEVDQLCRVVRSTNMKHTQIASAVLHAGYQCSISHTSARALKTDAPMNVIWDIIRCWVSECVCVFWDTSYDGRVGL
jgi:tRNA (guanine26-N2/guanine27-N2)-dimethyltransferase